jgi:alpha-L-rhamnosidase
MLGNGWWNPLPLKLFGRFNLRDVQQTGRPCLRADIRIRYTDGSEDVIPTDEKWLTTPGPIVRNNVYLGEHYDARLEVSGWNVKKGRTGWKPSVATDGPDGHLTVQMQPPIRVTRIVKPTRIFTVRPGVFIVDMGQNFAGVVRLKVKGAAGTKITIRYGEALQPDGSLNYLTSVAGQIKEAWRLSGGPGAPTTAWQEDSYILKGKDTEVWNPLFTFHGFRYVELTGWPGFPTLADIEGLRMNTDVRTAGEFTCSNAMFNKVHEAARWTFLSNIFSVQSDCPAREKMGYGADMVTTANSFLYNFDMSNFYAKAVKDFANEQRDDGGITEIAPYTGIHDRGVGGESGPLGWQLAFTFLQKRLYEFYGDRRIIEQHYPAVVKQIEFLTSHAIDGLFHWDISDHEALDPKPEAFSASAFYYHHALLAAEFAGLLGKNEDSLKYSTLANNIRERIISKYHVTATGRFDNGTQSAQLFSLWYGLTPEREKSMKVLMEEFERHKWHVSSGIFGIMMMFDVLREADQNEVAYTIASQKDFPGWGHMIAHGATTLWETWAYPENAPSQNHPMFGSIEEWFYRSLLGINPLAPGFRKIQIKPQPAGDLTWARGSYASIAGRISSDWKIDAGKFILYVSVPVNATAEVWIPSRNKTSLIENGAQTLRPVRYEKDYAIVNVGSGEYRFESK